MFYNDNAGGGLMKKVSIENSVTGMKYGAVLEEAAAMAWIAKCRASGCWGTVGDYTVTIIDQTEDPEYITEKAASDASKQRKQKLQTGLDNWDKLSDKEKLDLLKDIILEIVVGAKK
jgi:hypothetical protein